MEKLELTTDNCQVLDCRTLEMKKLEKFVYIQTNKQTKNELLKKAIYGSKGPEIAFSGWKIFYFLQL